MQDHVRYLILADVHVGAHRRPWLRKIGVTAEQYLAPFVEAYRWAADNDVDEIIIAGDLFDQRRPTPDDYVSVMPLFFEDHDLGRPPGLPGQISMSIMVVAGNHDINAIPSEDALWPIQDYQKSIEGPSLDTNENGDWPAPQILSLPWPRSGDYQPPEGLSIEDEINWVREAVLNELRGLADDIDPKRPAIGVGHLMLSYGGTSGEAPGLLLGKDIVIPYEDLLALPNIGGWYLGHVHKPGRGYVGSTQPTDWGDLGEKSFTVVDIWREGTTAHDAGTFVQQAFADHMTMTNPVNGWYYLETRVPYQTSLRLLNLEHDWGDDTPELEDATYDAIRITVHVTEDQQPVDVEAIESALYRSTGHVEVIIDREVKRAARVETAEPLSKMPVRDAAIMWHENRETEPELRDATMAAFDAITGED